MTSRYFEENPEELSHVRHDGELRTARQQAHLRHIPDYLLPEDGRKAVADEVGFVPMKKQRRMTQGRKGAGRGTARRGGKGGPKSRDPLKTFKARRKTTK